MKKVLIMAFVAGFTALGSTAQVQEDREVIIEKKIEGKGDKAPGNSQEIIIRKKGDKDAKITVEIKGDKITINGKPISEFKDGDITINKRELRFSNGRHSFSFAPGQDMEMLFNGDHIGDFGMGDGKPRAFLGVTTGAENDDNVKNTKPNGAAITNISKGSAAEKAGLKEGDIITKVGDKKIESPADLTTAIGSHKPKDEVTIQYKREGKELAAKAILGETKGGKAMAFSFNGPRGQMRSFTIPPAPGAPGLPGFDMPDAFDWKMNGDVDGAKFFGEGNNFNFPRQQKLGLKIQDTEEGNGVKVLGTDDESPAAKAGLQIEDVVTEIDGKKINNTDDAREQLREIAEKAAYNVKAKRNGKEMSFDIKIPKKLKTANL